MPNIIFAAFSGDEQTIDVGAGYSLMEGALWNGVEGIDADCGGACACATCHVLIAPKWFYLLPPASDVERDMIDALAHRTPTSRLSFQYQVTDAIAGMRAMLPGTRER